MTDLAQQTWIGIVKLVGGTALLLFIPAGTLFYLQAWIYLSWVTSGVLLITWYLWRHDQDLLARRLKVGVRAESEPRQKKILMAATVVFPLPLLLSALDHRYHWSHLTFAFEFAGLLLVAAGLGVIFSTFRANSFASSTISLATNHRLVTTGVYAYVRHPMYSGLILVFAGTPLELGSIVGMLGVVGVIAVLVVRLHDEETFLRRHFEGYAHYQKQVAKRLMPGVW